MKSFLDWLGESRYSGHSTMLEQGLLEIKEQLAEEVKQIMRGTWVPHRRSGKNAENKTCECFLDHLKF